MIKSKKINMIVAIGMFFALTLSILLIGLGNSVSGGKTGEPLYAEKIFGADIISIEILADEAEWQEMLDNATSEQFIMVDVIVNGTKFQDVGIRPKGNSSLSQVARDETSDRYSFRLQFDEYIKDQTCFGLDSFVINNMLSDNTYMKEYISYELMGEIGVNSPYFGYADIQLNGENWGLYLAVETYGDSYESRVSGDTLGMLYNVKSMDMGGGADENNGMMPNMSGGGFPQNGGNTIPGNNTSAGEQSFRPQRPTGENETENIPSNNNDGFGLRPDGGNFGGGGLVRGGDTGGSLAYIDDNSSSYSAIFDNVVGKGSEKDYQKVISGLKALSEGRELEKYFDVDQILRYLATHTIVVNLDSYSSSMAQNYYLYEKDGVITVLPWDYNMAWGGFQSGSASSVINFPIDTPVSGVEMSARPLLEKLFANAGYLERYHNYLQELLDKYFTNGQFETKITELDALISAYVKYDSTKFCTYEQYQTAVKALITLGELRAESVQGQLNGTIPSTTAEQNASADQLVSGESLNLSALGSMGGGGNWQMQAGQTLGGDNGGGQRPNGNNPFGENLDMTVMQKAMEIVQAANGEITDEVKTQLAELGLTTEQIDAFTNMIRFPGGGRMTNTPNQNNGPNSNTTTPSGAADDPTKDISYFIFLGVLTLVLAGVTLFAARLKKSY